MKQYGVVGFDAKGDHLFEVAVEAPNQAIARMMVLAQMSRFRFAVGTGWNFQNQLKLISLRGRNDKFIGAVD
jgi:hypothetical protein